MTVILDMKDIVNSWSYDIKATAIKTIIKDFETVETKTPIIFKGLLQPSEPKQTDIKPQGIRQWSSYRLHSTVNLNNFDYIVISNIKYRIMNLLNYNPEYGYYEYKLLQDYDNNK